MRGLPDDLRAAIRAWAEETAQAQGLGPKVGAAGVLASLVPLFESRSDAPDGRQPRVLKPVETAFAGADGEVVEDGADDLLLPGER